MTLSLRPISPWLVPQAGSLFTLQISGTPSIWMIPDRLRLRGVVKDHPRALLLLLLLLVEALRHGMGGGCRLARHGTRHFQKIFVSHRRLGGLQRHGDRQLAVGAAL